MSIPRKVLIIQEDRVIREILKRFVESLGFSSVAVPTLSKLESTEAAIEYDILLTDFLFEEMGRIDFSMQIRQKVRFTHAIVITNMGQDIVKSRFLTTQGFAGYYNTPLKLQEIKEKLLAL